MVDKSRENQDEAVAMYFRTILLMVQKGWSISKLIYMPEFELGTLKMVWDDNPLGKSYSSKDLTWEGVTGLCVERWHKWTHHVNNDFNVDKKM
jgi:hypothetical protein